MKTYQIIYSLSGMTEPFIVEATDAEAAIAEFKRLNMIVYNRIIEVNLIK